MDGPLVTGPGPDAAWAGSKLGRYRIDSFIAAGGMGEVYRGWDETLSKPVALKVLRRSLAREEHWRERFVREARNACRVQHPFVCSMLDVLEHGDDVILVMEFVDGHTLDATPPDDAESGRDPLFWATEIAEALRAIHEAGVVHRDLKPSNVMITRAGHVKVMDFGVARSGGRPGEETPSRDSTLTETGCAVGTIAYMAPEQLRGERTDARGDLFSLGIVLWQVISGEHPFDRGSPMATASAILYEAPGGEKVPDSITQSGPLRDVVMGLLLKDPEDRYQSAEALLVDLNAIAQGSRIYRRRAAVSARKRGWIAVAASAVAIVATVAALVWHERVSTFPPGISPRPLVAILPFEVRGGAVDPDTLGPMLADLVGAAAAGRGTLRRTPPDRMAEMLAGLPVSSRRRDAIERLRSLEAPRWIVAGAVYPAGEGYEASVDVYAGEDKPEHTFRTHGASYIALAQTVASTLLDRVDKEESSKHAPPLPPPSTRSDDAAILLAQARRARRELRLGDALALAEQALAKDPRYVDAAIERVHLLVDSGFGNRSREAADALERLVDATGLPADSRLKLDADVASARAQGRSEARYQILRSLLTRYPDEPALAASLADVAMSRGRADEALNLADSALAMDPKSPSLLLLHARAATGLRKFPIAETDLQRAWDIVSATRNAAGQANVVRARGDLAWQAGRLDEAESFYRSCAEEFSRLSLSGDAALCRSDWSGLEVLAGRLSSARALIVPAIAEARASGALGSASRWLSSFGASLFVAGRLPEAESTLREACGIARQIENDAILLPATINLASVVAYTGRFAEARGLAEDAMRMARSQGDVGAEMTATLLRCDSFFSDGSHAEATRCYGAVVDASAAVPAQPEVPAWARLGRAEVAEDAGDLGTAWSEVRRVLDARPSPSPVQRGYAHLREASLLAAFGDADGARTALDRAERIASDPGAGLEDLAIRTKRIRGDLALRMGDVDAAATIAAAVVKAGRESGASGLTSPALALRASALLATGRLEEARADAEAAGDAPGTRFSERVRARVVAAEVAAATGDSRRAGDLARRALDEAESANLRFEIVRAATVIVALPKAFGGRRAADARRSGRSALDALLRSCPVEKQPSFLTRPDVRRWRAALEWSPEAA